MNYLVPTTALLAASLLACREGHTQQARREAPPIAVHVAPVQRVHKTRPVLGTGQLATKAEVRASFKVGGLIRTIDVEEGARIKRGQVLATLVTTEVDAGVEQARQAVVKAERDRERVAKLLEGRAATGSQLDDATTGLSVAKAQLRAAEFNRAHAVIRAPRDGRVLRRMAEAGELIGAGQPVLVLAGDDNDWVLRVGLADRDVVRLREQDAATLVFPAWPDAPPLQAKVSEIASAALPPLGLYEVELRVVPDGRVLKAGMIAHATIAPEAREQVAVIPAVALRDGDGRRATVWAPTADGKVTRREVETAFFDGADVAIKRGLEGVDRVVTDGAAYLADGSRIEVRP